MDKEQEIQTLAARVTVLETETALLLKERQCRMDPCNITLKKIGRQLEHM